MEAGSSSPSRRPTRVSAGSIPAAAAALVELRSLFDRAVDTAFFILGDRARAVDVAIEAMAKLHVAARAQKRRRAYLPKGRSASGVAQRATRTRVSADEGHLLQRLVFVESERWEREQEQAGRVDARAMLLRYVKHLVRIGLKRNSFYVVLGVSRLLHHYSTIETMEIYSLVIQDPDRVRDDHYYRARKKQLLEEVLARFEGFLQVESGPRGEHRIRTAAADPAMQAFVAECLRRFTPWDTGCVVPERFDPWSAQIPALLFQGTDPDDEHPIETNRFHATLDPDCYARVAAALALPPPAERLALPEFGTAEPDPGRPGGSGPGSEWDDDFQRAQGRWSDDAQRRRQSDGRVIVVIADGVERARLDLDESPHTRVRVPAGTELVEVRGARGETLAVWLAGFEPPRLRSSAEYVVAVENGREIVIRRDRPDDLADFDLDVTCREAHAVRTYPLTGWAQVRRVLRVAPPRSVWAAAFAVALGLAAVVWRPSLPIVPPAGPDSGLTRGGAAGVTLAGLRRIYVDPLGESGAALTFREALGERLAGSDRFERAQRRSDAEAVLTGSWRDGEVALALVNARGDVLWRGTRTVSAGETPAAGAAALVEALVTEARRAATASRP